MTQITLKRPMTAQGVGLHTGRKVTLTMAPAPVDHGIVFQRVDLEGQPKLPALWDRVGDSRLCTVIAENGVSVGTIEHIMAALRAAQIDNALIQLDGPEVPIMDGSAEPFDFLITCAGLASQEAPRKTLHILKTVRIEEGDKSAEFAPSAVATFSFAADFAHPVIGKQEHSLTMVNGNYLSQISRARTFGFAHEVDHLRSLGLAQGGSLDNAIVLDQDKMLNAHGLRFPDEFVRHKILDAIGDLYLAGMPIIGHYHGVKAGHALNNKLLHALFADPSAYKIL